MARRNAGGGPLAREAASTASNAIIPDDIASVARGAGVVDLQVERRRRLLRDLGLEPVPVCSGVCRCWGGVPLGGWSA